MKKLLFLLISVPLLAGGWIVTDRITFDRVAWIADYEQLRTATEQSYANLKWSRSSKEVDLVALNEEALRDLELATSNSTARRALSDFVSGFKDAHFRLESGPPRPVKAVVNLFKSDATPALDFKMSGEQACSALGFSRATHSLGMEGPNVQTVEELTFAAGTLTTASRRKYGIIRIPVFQQREYGAICERAWESFRSARGGACDDDYEHCFSIVAKRAVAQKLADDARTLARSAPDGIVIDLTGNGGGTEWAEFAAAALTPNALKPPDVRMIRGPHWQKSFREDVALFDADLKKVKDAGKRQVLINARVRALAMIDSANVTCELHAIWRDRSAQPDCWNVIPVLPYLDSAELDAVRGLESSFVLLPSDAIQRADRPYDGTLYIMIDRHTASASEQFAGTLVDNAVAKTIGEPTMGVGCGYTNGGNPIKLKHSGLTIWMPDCARLRANGSNEFQGIKPDYPADWGKDGATKARALASILDSIP